MYIKMYIGGFVKRPHSIAEARRNLPKLVREAESGGAVEVTRRGKPVAVLIGRRQFDRLASHLGFSDAWDAFASSVDLGSLNIDPDDAFSEVRDVSPGRERPL